MRRYIDLNAVLGENLSFFMKREDSPYRNANALGKAAKVAPNTIRNLLDPEKRTTTASKPRGYPTLDKIEKIATALKCEVWELLHPDIQRSIRERAFYANIERDYEAMTQHEKKQREGAIKDPHKRAANPKPHRERVN